MGIEPTLVAWEATVLPLNYTRSVTERMKAYLYGLGKQSGALYLKQKLGICSVHRVCLWIV